MTTSVIHENTIFAEPIFHIGSIEITNSLLNSWLVVLMVIIISLLVYRKISLVPGKLQSIFEMIIEKLLEISDSITGSRKKSVKFFPIIFSIFMFILLNNWLGIFPGIGSIGKLEPSHEGMLFIPFFRGGTADLNTTLALASFAVTASHILGILALGAWNHFNKFIQIKAIVEMVKKAFKNPVVLVINPIKIFVGLLEIVGELAKVASLSFRLFGNVFAGEVLLTSMSAILAFGLPIPFMFMEVIIGLVQAFIFSILTLVYFSINTTAEEH